MKGRLFKISLFLFLSIITTQIIYAQHLDSLLNKLDSAYPQEKLYLQFDRPYYNPGETIWFKAYLTSDNLPSNISKTVYAELIDAKGKIVARKIMPVIQSGASSSFDLPDSMNNTIVYVRAYTAWMLNFDSSLLYVKPIRIINTVHTIKKNSVATLFNLQFFPEGGDLVSGLSSRIAFKANDQYGVPFAVNGMILDDNGKQITHFSSTHDGMGFFYFTPLASTKYRAVWKDKKGQTHETLLPDTKKDGITLYAENVNNNINYTLTRQDSATTDATSYYVVAQMQQQLVYSAVVNMNKKTSITAPIPTDSLTDGIIQVTVFNSNKIPVAERILFINRGNYYFTTDLHAVEKNITKRGHNTLQIDVGGSLLSNLSIAVTDETLNPDQPDKEENIFSRLLLTSDIRGFVYNPDYYFSNDDDSVKQQLDLVMMTNGWRRFKWEDLLANKWPRRNYLPEHYLSVKGGVYGLTKNSLYGQELTGVLKTKGGGSQILSLPINREGAFKKDGIYFFDTAKLYYQLNNDKDKRLTSTASFLFEGSFIKEPMLFASTFNPDFAIEPDTSTAKKNKLIASLLKQELGNVKIKTLKEITVTTVRQKTLQEKMDEEYTSGFFSGGDEMSFINQDNEFEKSAPDVLTYLQGRVAGLQVSSMGPDASVTWRGSPTSLYLNQMATDANQLKAISLSDVAMVKVFRPPFLGDFGTPTISTNSTSGTPNVSNTSGAGGAIAVYTKNGKEVSSSAKGLDYATINGYSAIKQFYSPDYSTDPTSMNDYRTTLYWNPFLLMDKNIRRIMIPFFNSDNCKRIKVVIEGINEAGQLTREEKIFE
jgi:hypothetical protein